MKQSDNIQKPRRRFLQQLMVLGGATGATAVALNTSQAGTQSQQPEASAAPAAPAKKGYRLTKHIRTYYEKAQI